MKLRFVSCKIKYQGGIHTVNDINSLAYTKWNCKYHIFLYRNMGEKYFTVRRRQKLGKYWGSYVAGKVQRL